jgi:hypothetical protein
MSKEKEGKGLPLVYSMTTEDDGEKAWPMAIGLYSGETEEYTEFHQKGEGHDLMWEFLTFIKDNHPGETLYANDAVDTDHKFIVNTLVRHGEDLDFPGGTAKIRWTEPKINFMDAYQVMAMGLNKASRAMQITRRLEGNNGHDPKLYSDCIALSETLQAFEDLINSYFPGVSATKSSTLSLTAVKIFDKRYFPLKEINPNEAFEDQIRLATYAGRNEVYRRYGENINMYDIRGNYISCYDVPIPIGKLRWTTPNLDHGTLAEAKVSIPHTLFVGPLPCRINGRLVFPTGNIVGWWDIVDLRGAAMMGCDIEVLRQLEGDEVPIMREFGERVCALRDEAEYGRHNPDLGRIFKTLGLRLCGKFGQHRVRTEVKKTSSIDDLVGWSPLDEEEMYHERTVKLKGNRMPYVKPAINMRIRSEARRRHLSYLLEAEGNGELFYSDTDSVYTTANIDTGEKHGALQLKDKALRGYFIKPKVYGYIDRYEKTRQRTAGFKDMPLTEVELEGLIKGEEVECRWKGLTGWKEIMVGRTLGMVERKRTLRDDGMHNRVVLEDRVSTRPVRVEMFS